MNELPILDEPTRTESSFVCYKQDDSGNTYELIFSQDQKGRVSVATCIKLDSRGAPFGSYYFRPSLPGKILDDRTLVAKIDFVNQTFSGSVAEVEQYLQTQRLKQFPIPTA